MGNTALVVLDTKHYGSVSQPVSRDALMCRQILLSVPTNRIISNTVWRKCHFSIILVLLLHFGVPPKFFTKLVCRKIKKVENHCITVSFLGSHSRMTSHNFGSFLMYPPKSSSLLVLRLRSLNHWYPLYLWPWRHLELPINWKSTFWKRYLKSPFTHLNLWCVHFAPNVIVTGITQKINSCLTRNMWT